MKQSLTTQGVEVKRFLLPCVINGVSLGMFKKLIVFIALCAFAAAPGWAADYFSPRIAALGGAGRAGPLLNDAIYLNPSFTSFLPTYSLGLNYSWINAPADTGRGIQELGGRNYSASIQDGRNELFQAGAAYTLREDGAFVHVGASKAIVQRLGLGVSGKFFFSGPGRAAGKDLVISTTAVPFEWLQVAGVVDNALETTESKSRGLYRQYILGTKWNVEKIVLAYFDPHYTPSLDQGSRYGYSSGLEFVMMSDLFLRLGAFRNATIPYLASALGRGYGAGLGWVGPRLSLDYGISRAIEPRTVTVHSLGMTIYF
jgi:hypothetical protein